MENKMAQLENRQEQLQFDMKVCGLREFNELYCENLIVTKQLENLQKENNNG